MRLRHLLRKVFASLLFTFAAGAAWAQSPFETTFMNPIAEGADPWVVAAFDRYYWCFSEGNRGVAIWSAKNLTTLGEKHVVWRAPESGPYSRQIWAPELHRLGDRWYIYVAASDGKNEHHRMIVLQSAADDPLSEYHFKAELYTGDDIKTKRDNRWAIDGTILRLRGRNYFVWSGWQDERDLQWLYIAEMENPWTIATNRIRLCANDDYLWERVGEKPTGRGLAEAPEALERNGRTWIIYSTSGSWQPTYKLGMLELAPDGNPLDPAAWHKHPEPVFQSTEKVFGVGHNAFVRAPASGEDWFAYHAKLERADGWKRAIYLQPLHWRSDGSPDFGTPLAPRGEIPLPADEKHPSWSGPFNADFKHDLQLWAYYGHHELYHVEDAGVHLGGEPGGHVNAFSSGEKLLLHDRGWLDCLVTAKLRVLAGGGPAGILFRASAVSLGFNAQCAYFAGLVPERNEVILGRTDGERWTPLAQASLPLVYGRDYTLQVSAVGPEIVVAVDGQRVLEKTDTTWAKGMIGLRVANAEAIFTTVEVR